MENNRFFVEKIRFHLFLDDTVSFTGWYFDGHAKGRTIEAYLDKTKCHTDSRIFSGPHVRQKYLGNFNEINEEVIGMIALPQDWENADRLTLWVNEDGVRKKAYAVSVSKLKKMRHQLEYYIESEQLTDGQLVIIGWCMGAEEVSFTLLDERGNILPIEVDRYFRKDLKTVFPEQKDSKKPGFRIQANLNQTTKTVSLVMEDNKHRSLCKISGFSGNSAVSNYKKKAHNAVRYFMRNGVRATVRKVNTKLSKKSASNYDQWRAHYEIKAEEIERQRSHVFEKNPLFSIVIPLYRTKEVFLHELITSIENQTYSNWELCLADGSADGSLTKILENYKNKNSKIKVAVLKENKGIAGNTNEAVSLACGDYLVLADHDDILPPNALYELADAVNKDETIDVLYSDEDKVSMNGKKYFEPHFKSDYNPDLLCSMNYICHLFAVKRTLQQEVGLFRSEYDGAQDYDFILRCCEKAENIFHIPKILYHWRCHMQSTAANPESKLYAFEAGKRAIEAHYKRMNLPAHVEHAQFYGMYHTIYEWEQQPLLSIVIPNKDHVKDLKKCISSICEKSNYQNLEFVIVENNSTEQETFAFYEQLKKEHKNVTICYYDGTFNYSKINNFGVSNAKGDYLLLLNNDTEMIDETAIREMINYCMRDDVGVVGARLYYEDDTIQHAGVVIGFGGMAGHTFIGKSRHDIGYFGRIACVQDYSAVTAACLMTKKSVYEAAGGLDEKFQVAFNDIDYCLKVRQLGKLVVYNPYAQFYHYESKSRGLEDTPEKVERFSREVERLVEKWPDYFKNGDPYYNRNLTLDNSDFSLRR